MRRTVSNEVGLFAFPALQPGPYTIRAELTGFRPIEIRDNMVLANNRLAIPPLRLEVGSLTEAVTVSAVGEVVATTQTTHQAVLDVGQVENLSIRGRDPMSLLKILPGVQLLANDNETVGGGFNSPVPSLQGGQGQTVYIDGINGGDGGGGGALSGTTVIDAIAEVNVQMSAYTAEYGLKGGSQVNVITKHGGAEYHVPRTGTGAMRGGTRRITSTRSTTGRSPSIARRTLGGTVGGPIPRMKGINSDGEKLFFFYVLDDTQAQRLQTLKFYQVPTALERGGDFSQSVTPSGALISVRDPQTNAPFPGNRIPASRLDPRGQAFLNLYPMPNTTGVNGYNYVTQEPSIDWPRRQHMFRGDYRPTDKDSLAVKYQTFYTRSVGINVDGASARWGLVRQRYDFDVDIAKVDYTRILNTSTILEFSTGFFNSVEDGPPEDDVALAGIQRATYPQLARLGQFAGQHNPLGLTSQAVFGNIQSADRAQSNDGGGTAWVTLRRTLADLRQRHRDQRGGQPDAHARPSYLQDGRDARGPTVQPGTLGNLRRDSSTSQTMRCIRTGPVTPGRTLCSGRSRVTRNRWAECPTTAARRHGRGTCKTPGSPRRRSRWTSGCACTSGDRHSRKAEKRRCSATSDRSQSGEATHRCSISQCCRGDDACGRETAKPAKSCRPRLSA